MDVYWLAGGGVERCATADLPALLARPDGFVWVDIPACAEQDVRELREAFGFHSLALRDCCERNLVPKVHAYADHLFIILHAPEPEASGHVHLLELDQFVGRRYLVTLHGPLDAGVPLDAALRETRAVLARVEAGRLRPKSPADLSYSIVAALTRHMEAFLSSLRSRVATLEQRVMEGDLKNPELALEEMFRLRHELLTVRTMATESRELYARVIAIAPRFVPAEDRPFMEDLLDLFDRIRSMCDSEREFLQGVIDFYQTRTTTKMNIAMERLALLTALLLPVTAVASIYGMNIIVSEHTHLVHLAVVLILLGIIMALMLQWTRRQGWW